MQPETFFFIFCAMVAAVIGFILRYIYKWITYESEPNKYSKENYVNEKFEAPVSHQFSLSESKCTLVIQDQIECKRACDALIKRCQRFQALGFDCEWIPVTVKEQKPNVSMLQLASADGLVCLFRLNKLQGIPFPLADILENVKIIKVGVGPLLDAYHLNNQYNVNVRGTLDLRFLYPGVLGGLSGLSERVLGKPMDKTIRVFDWLAPSLSQRALHYAADDVVAAIQILVTWICELNAITDLLFDERLRKAKREFRWLRGTLNNFLDRQFKSKQSHKGERSAATQKKPNYATRQSPVYHNCFMHAPDGNLLCSCDRRKADWYVEKGLAEVMQREPYSVRLLFEPAERATDENGGRYYQQLKQNLCVVCGSSQSYLKHHVVPKEYRKHFPGLMKDHQSHDVVLMCSGCHHVAVLHNESLRKKLESLCDAPIKISQVKQNKPIVNIKNCAKALLTSGNVIPQERKAYLEKQVKDFYEVGTITPDLLKVALSLDDKTRDESIEPHGLKVVNYYRKNDGLLAFEKMWREHFLDTMNPKYLPALWSVTHNHARVAARLKNEGGEFLDSGLLNIDSENYMKNTRCFVKMKNHFQRHNTNGHMKNIVHLEQVRLFNDLLMISDFRNRVSNRVCISDQFGAVNLNQRKDK